MPNLILDQMTWKDVEKHLPDLKVALIPVGSSEQHGPHLPLQVDTLCAEVVCRAVSELLYPKALTVTHIPVGVSYHHLRFPGSLAISESTLTALVYEVSWSLSKHGIKNIVIVNGHYGNVSALSIAARRAADEMGLRCFAINYWDFMPEDDKAIIQDGVIPGHAAEFETSIMLFANPSLVDSGFKRTFHLAIPQVEFQRLVNTNLKKLFEMSEDGLVLGDPAGASAKKGERIVKTVAGEIATYLSKEFEFG